MGRLRGLAPYAVLLAEVLVFYRKVLFSSHWGIPWDLRSYHLPLASFLADSLRRGELPLWDPYTYCGFPFFASITAQVFYPPTWLAVWLSNLTGGMHLAGLLEWQIALHVFLAGLFTYWLLRRLDVSATAALLGATIYQLGGYFASQTQHLGAMDAAAWLPLAWLSLVELGRGHSWRWMGALSGAMAMSILAGFPAESFVLLGSSLLLAVILAAFRYAPLRLAGSVALACVWSLLLAAAQLVPGMQLSRLSVAQYRSDWMGTGGGLPLQSLVSLVAPDHYGIFDLSKYSSHWNPTFLYIYCGMVGLVFVALSALSLRRAYVKVFVALVILSAVWMLGDSTPLGRYAFPLLPGALKQAIYAESAMAAFVLAFGILAGLSAGRFLGSRRPLLGACVVLVAAVDLTLVGSARPMNTYSLDKEPGLSRTQFDGSREVLDRVRELTSRSTPPARIDTVDDSMDWAMGAALIEIPTANGNDPMALIRLMQVRRRFTGGKRWGRYYQVSEPDSPVLPLLNVRFLLSRSGVSSKNYVKIAEIPGRAVYENERVLPRFFLVGRTITVRDMEEGLRLMKAGDFDPRSVAIVEGPVEVDGRAGGAVRVVRYAPRQVILDVGSEDPAFLVTSETYYPGWRAWVDGVERPLLLTNVAFRGLPVPAGRHRVEMRFEPRILWYSLAAGFLGWAALVWAMARAPRRSSP